MELLRNFLCKFGFHSCTKRIWKVFVNELMFYPTCKTFSQNQCKYCDFSVVRENESSRIIRSGKAKSR